MDSVEIKITNISGYSSTYTIGRVHRREYSNPKRGVHVLVFHTDADNALPVPVTEEPPGLGTPTNGAPLVNKREEG